MSNNFQVGQKVVHVPNMGGKYNLRELFPQLRWPVANEVYTIRHIKVNPTYPNGDLRVGLALVEIPDQIHPGCGGVTYWAADEFYPVAFLDIDISIFTEMLTNTKVTV